MSDFQDKKPIKGIIELLCKAATRVSHLATQLAQYADQLDQWLKQKLSDETLRLTLDSALYLLQQNVKIPIIQQAIAWIRSVIENRYGAAQPT